MDLLEPLSNQTKWQMVFTLLGRLLLPFLLGGVTFHFALGSRQVNVKISADIARLEQKVDTVQKNVNTLAGMVPLPDQHEVQPKKLKGVQQ